MNSFAPDPGEVCSAGIGFGDGRSPCPPCFFTAIGVCYRCGFENGETCSACSKCGKIWCLRCDGQEGEALTAQHALLSLTDTTQESESRGSWTQPAAAIVSGEGSRCSWTQPAAAPHHRPSHPPNGPGDPRQTSPEPRDGVKALTREEAAEAEIIVLGGVLYLGEALLGDDTSVDMHAEEQSTCWLDYRSLTGLNPPSLESDPLFIPCLHPSEVLMQACQTQVDAAEQYVDIWGMIDRGANCDVLVLDNAQRYALGSIDVDAQIGTHVKGMGATVKQVHKIPALLEDGSQIVFPRFNDSPSSGKTLLNEMGMWYRCHCWVHTPSSTLITCHGGHVRLHQFDHDPRLWLKLRLRVIQPHVPASVLEAAVVEPLALCAAVAQPMERATLLAARHHCSAEGLLKLSGAITNLNSPSHRLSPTARQQIDSDKYRKVSTLRRMPAPHHSPSRLKLPGAALIGDEWGPVNTKCILSGCRSQFGSVCGQSYGVIMPLSEYTVNGVYECIANRVLRERAVGNEPIIFLLDRLPAHESPKLRERCERDLRITLLIGPSKYHETVGAEEVNGDILTRMCEASYARACAVEPNLCGPQFYLLCRAYQQDVLNDRPCGANTLSRKEKSGRPRPDAHRMTKFCWWSTVVVYREKPDRVPHGQLDQLSSMPSRGYEARLVGISDMSYIVWNPSTGQFTYPVRVTPLNEHVVAAAGLPAGAASIDSQVQVNITDLPLVPHLPPPPPPRVPRAVITTHRREPYELHSRLSVRYLMDGKEEWHDLTVDGRNEMASGRFEYLVTWDDGEWNRNPAWEKFRCLDLQRADAPPSKLTWVPSRDRPSPPQLDVSLPHTGEGLHVLLVYGGDDPKPDGIKDRILQRLPMCTVHVEDLKTGFDARDRSARLTLIRKIRTVYDLVMSQQPCTPYTTRRSNLLGDKSDWFDLDTLTAEDKAFLIEQFVLRDLGFDALQAAEKTPWCKWLVESTPDRAGTPGPWGAADKSPAHWAEHASRRSLWDEREMSDLLAMDAYRVLCSACWFDELDYQKMFELAFCRLSANHGKLHFPEAMRLCLHASHPTVIGGYDAEGRSIAEESGVYKPGLADAFARFIVHTLTSQHPQPEDPPFHQPPIAQQQRIARVAARRSPRFASAAQVDILLRDIDDHVLSAVDHVEALACCAYKADGTQVSSSCFDESMQELLAPRSTGLPLLLSPPPPDTVRSSCIHKLTLAPLAFANLNAAALEALNADPSVDGSPPTIDTTLHSASMADDGERELAALLEANVADNASDDGELPDLVDRSSVGSDGVADLAELDDSWTIDANAAAYITEAADVMVAARERVREHRREHRRHRRSSHGSSKKGALEAAKATQNVVKVKTGMGEQTIKVPATTKQVFADVHSEKWLEADRKAHVAILKYGNRLVRQDSVPKGTVIANVVTARKYKTTATGEADPHDPFKSRHAVDEGRKRAIEKSLGKEAVKSPVVSIADDVTMGFLLADAAVRDRDLAKADVSNAYAKADRIGRPVSYMFMAATVQEYDEDNTPLVYELTTPLWGEEPAGYEWDVKLDHVLTKVIGMSKAEGVPAAYFIETEEGDVRMVKIVDDLIFSESKSSGRKLQHRVLQMLKSEFNDEVKFEEEPTSVAAIRVDRSPDRSTLTISMPDKIDEAVREFLPEILDGSKPARILTGKALHDAADALRMPTEQPMPMPKAGKRVQQALGKLKFPEKRCIPALTLVLHRLSCIMKYPPPEATLVTDSVLYMAYQHRSDGITFSRYSLDSQVDLAAQAAYKFDLDAPAPLNMTASGDASTGHYNVYANILMYGGGCIFHCVKKIGSIVDSIMRAEMVATQKCSELVEYATTIERAFGIERHHPVPLATDNLGNKQVVKYEGSAARSRHFLVRYDAIKMREEQGIIRTQHVPDEHMPADFLTKWVGLAKLRRCLAYVTNSRMRHKSSSP